MSTSRQNQSQCYVDKKSGESGKDYTCKEPGDCKVNDGQKVVPVDKLTHIDCENKAHKDHPNTFSQNKNQITDQLSTLYYQEEVTIKDLPKNTDQKFFKQEGEEFFKYHQKQLKPEKEECHSSHHEMQSKPNQEHHKNHDISKNLSHHSQEGLSKQQEQHVEVSKNQQEDSHKNHQAKPEKTHIMCHQEEPTKVHQKESPIKNEVGSYDSKNPNVSRHNEPPKLKEIETVKQNQMEGPKSKEMEVQLDNHSIHHSTETTMKHQVDDPKCKAQPQKTHLIKKQTSLEHCDETKKASQETSKDHTHKGPEDSELNDGSKEVHVEKSTQTDSEKEAQTDHKDTLYYQEEITTKDPLPKTTQEQLTKNKEEEYNKLHQKQLKPQKEEFHSSQQEKALRTNQKQPKEQQENHSKYDSTKGGMKHQAHDPKCKAETLNTKGTMSAKGQKKCPEPCAPPQPQCQNPCEPEPVCQEPAQQVCEPEPVCEPQCPPPQDICAQSTQQQPHKGVKK